MDRPVEIPSGRVFSLAYRTYILDRIKSLWIETRYDAYNARDILSFDNYVDDTYLACRTTAINTRYAISAGAKESNKLCCVFASDDPYDLYSDRQLFLKQYTNPGPRSKSWRIGYIAYGIWKIKKDLTDRHKPDQYLHKS